MIGFYDSGIGGLTIVQKFLELKPKTSCLYFADTANCPLGEKTDIEILRASIAGVERLFAEGCKLVVLACNTATSIAIRPIQQEWLPNKRVYEGHNVLGVVKPVTEELVNQRSNVEPILLMATTATCRSNFYQNELESEGFSRYDCLSFSQLALAIENQDQELVDRIIEKELNNAKIAKFQTFALACTHYPLVKNQIKDTLSKNLDYKFNLIDQSELVAKRLVSYLENHPEYSLNNRRLKIYLSDDDKKNYADKVVKLFPNLIFRIN